MAAADSTIFEEMKTPSNSANGTRFEYIFDDPVSGGKWKILSHKKLTSAEIQKRLRFMAVCGYQRPANGQTTLFKWPKTAERDC